MIEHGRALARRGVDDLADDDAVRDGEVGRHVVQVPVRLAHGGVGELLTDLYPAGRVPPGDRARLAERAAELMRAAPAIPPLTRYRLIDMQQATLDLYQELVGEPRRRREDR